MCSSDLFSVPGTPYEQRSLPYDQSKLAYNVYVVRQPLDVEACRIAPWFDAKGGGEQFKTGPRAYELKAKGVIAPR